MSGSNTLRTKRAFSYKRATDSVTRKAVLLCMNTVTAPIIRNEPMESATMSSISVTPSARLNVCCILVFTVIFFVLIRYKLCQVRGTWISVWRVIRPWPTSSQAT